MIVRKVHQMTKRVRKEFFFHFAFIHNVYYIYIFICNWIHIHADTHLNVFAFFIFLLKYFFFLVFFFCFASGAKFSLKIFFTDKQKWLFLKGQDIYWIKICLQNMKHDDYYGIIYGKMKSLQLRTSNFIRILRQRKQCCKQKWKRRWNNENSSFQDCKYNPVVEIHIGWNTVFIQSIWR